MTKERKHILDELERFHEGKLTKFDPSAGWPRSIDLARSSLVARSIFRSIHSTEPSR